MSNRQDLRDQPILVDVVLPHFDQVLWAQDERLSVVVVLKDLRKRRRHQRLAEANHVANEHAVALVEVMGGDLDGGRLKLEELVAEVCRDAKFGEAMPRLLREVISHLDVDVVRRDDLVTRPALFDDLDQLGGDVDAPAIVPAVFEPLGEFLRRIVIQDVDVELSLMREARERQVAAS